MAATKSGVSVIASTASTTTSSAIDISAAYAVDVYVDMVQVGTATTPASVQIQISPDGGSTYYSPATLLWTSPVAAGTYDAVIAVPFDVTHFKAVFTQQSGGTSSTVVVQAGKVTGI